MLLLFSPLFVRNIRPVVSGGRSHFRFDSAVAHPVSSFQRLFFVSPVVVGPFRTAVSGSLLLVLLRRALAPDSVPHCVSFPSPFLVVFSSFSPFSARSFLSTSPSPSAPFLVFRGCPFPSSLSPSPSPSECALFPSVASPSLPFPVSSADLSRFPILLCYPFFRLLSFFLC